MRVKRFALRRGRHVEDSGHPVALATSLPHHRKSNLNDNHFSLGPISKDKEGTCMRQSALMSVPAGIRSARLLF